MKFQDLLENISHTHAELQIKAVQSVNQALTNSTITAGRIRQALTVELCITDAQIVKH